MDAIDYHNNVKGIVYSCYSYYSKKMNLDSYLGFKASKASSEQRSRLVLHQE